jgi:hypothetical protein
MGGPLGVEDGGRVLMALSHTQVGRAALEVIPGLWLINTFDAVARGVLRTSTRPTFNFLLLVLFRASV